jgi:Ran GTPase-activating protein (RanGAP) involved in mRNA processing and transport
VGDYGVCFLVKIISSNNNILHTLHLKNTGITDEGAKYLVEMIKRNKTLTHLGLGMNQLSDNGIRLLANAMENHNTTIRWLDLSERQFID